MKNWQVYILQCRDGSLYTGITTNPERRIKEHNTSPKGAKYTRSRRPVKLVYLEESEDRSAASKREWAIKKLTRNEKLLLVSKYNKDGINGKRLDI